MFETINALFDQTMMNFGSEFIGFLLLAVKFGGIYLLAKIIFGSKGGKK